jgi:ankyrin repeat protein
VAKLLERGADTEIIDSEGLSPLHVAADEGCEEVIRLLIQEGQT